jgi:hypothetical protein
MLIWTESPRRQFWMRSTRRLPTITSSVPGLKLRPWTIRSSSLRISKDIGCTPRSGTFVWPPLVRSRSTARYASIEATGPSGSTSISGTDFMSFRPRSRLNWLSPSFVAPGRRNTATSSRPPVVNIEWKPCCSANTPEMIATVAPMPRTVNSVALLRTNRLRRL